MFRGIATASLDAKGRMPLPAMYRDAISARADGKLVVTINIAERCLMLYSAPEWELVQRRLEAMPNGDGNAAKLQRLLIGFANDLQLDSTGRILLPQKLRDYAGLTKKVVTVGQGHKIELWNEATFDKGVDEILSPDGVQQLLGSDEYRNLRL